MAERAARMFRLDNEVLAFRFTATLSDRAGAAPLERLTSPERLRLWLDAVELSPGRPVTAGERESALTLREAIYRLGSALARRADPPPADVLTLNAAAAGGLPQATLTPTGRRWLLDRDEPVAAALAVIAHDAIAVLGTDSATRIKTCDGPECAGLFLDTSRGINRRWCSMNTCGNRAKKARMHHA